MKEMITVEKAHYEQLQANKEKLLSQSQKMRLLYEELSELRKRYYVLLTTKENAEAILKLGNYVE